MGGRRARPPLEDEPELETIVDPLSGLSDAEAADLDTLLELKDGDAETPLSMPAPSPSDRRPRTVVKAKPTAKPITPMSSESEVTHSAVVAAGGADAERFTAMPDFDTSSEQRFGRFRLLGRIGEGGMAEVRVAIEELDDGRLRPCVIKYMRPGKDDDPDFRAMFAEEGRISARFDHPNVVRCYGAGELGSVPYIALELIDGLTLIEVERHAAPGRTPVPAVVEIGQRITAALSYLHALTDDDGAPLHLVHRDVSPDNILVARRGVVKLVDFGIARFEGRGLYTATGVVRGKLFYMSPEQIKAEPLDAASDRYALAVVLARLLAGRDVLPKEPRDILTAEARLQRALEAAKTPPKLTRLLVAMVALQPARRPAAAEVEARLAEIAAEVHSPAESLERFTHERIFATMPPLVEASREVTHITASLQRFLSQVSKRSLEGVEGVDVAFDTPKGALDSPAPRATTPAVVAQSAAVGVTTRTLDAKARRQLVVIAAGLGLLAVILVLLLLLQ